MTKRTLLSACFSGLLALCASTALATDTDSDGLSDSFESAFGSDMFSSNPDGDGWTDFEEIFVHGTDPWLDDTDGDGTRDHLDALPLQAGSPPDGVSATSLTGGPTGTLWALSGESPTDGIGVHPMTGRFQYSHSAGGAKGVLLNFGMQMLYDSRSDYGGVAGVQRHTMLDMTYTVSSNDVYWRMWDGSIQTFTYSAGPPPTYSNGAVTGKLTVVDDGPDPPSYLYTTAQGFEFHLAGGVLDKIADPYGNEIDFIHNGSKQVTSVVDSRGESNTVTYYSTGRIKDITYADGRVWTFEYNDFGQLARTIGPATTTFSAGITTEYRYINGAADPALNGNMTQVIDGRGQAWLQVQYDEQDRVSKQIVGASGQEYVFDYTNQGSQSVTVTDPVGNDRVWEWHSSKLTKTELKEQSNRNVRTSDPTEWVTEWEHDADGYLTKVTLPEGNGIKYTLNSVKLATERRHKADMTAQDGADDLIHAWTYDSTRNYRVDSYIDPEGNQTDYTLNSVGQPTTVTFETLTNVTPTQTITHTYTYNSDGTKASSTDGEGKQTSYTYYGSTDGKKEGRLKSVKVDDGGLNLVTEYDYTDWGDRKKVTDPEGNVTEYLVEGYGNVTRITYPTGLGYITELGHDANLNVTLKQLKNLDETGAWDMAYPWIKTAYTYNTMDRVTSETRAETAFEEFTTTYDYDANYNVEKVVRDGVEVEMTFDERNLLHTRTRTDATAADSIEKYTYDENRNVSQYKDGRDKATTYEYDGFDRRTKTINALGDYEVLVYDECGQVVERKFYDETGATDDLMAHHKRHYDEMDRLYKVEDLLEGTTNTWYDRVYTLDKRGLVTKFTDRRGKQADFVYDGAGRRTKTTDAEGNVTDVAYDDNGNVTSVTEKETVPGSSSTEDFVTEFTYDALNRRLTQKVVDRNLSTNHKTTTWKYDCLSFVRETVDPKGYATTFERDAHGRMTRKTAPIDGTETMVTQWEYDAWDNVTELTDDNGSSTTYTYDGMNRLTKKAYADAAEVTFAYDQAHNVTRMTDQNGTQVDQEYDDLNRLVAREATLATGVGGDTTEDFTYDALSRLTQAKDDDSIVNLTYDSLSRIKSEQQGDNPLGATGKTVSYIHDAESNLTRIVYPSMFESRRTYDDINRLVGLDDKTDGPIADIDFYGAGGRRKQVAFGNNTTSNWTWDGFRRPTAIAHKDSAPTEFAGFDYGWDKNDNPTYEEQSHKSGKGFVYGYDRSNRLTTVLTGCDDPSNEVANPGTEAYSDKIGYVMDEVYNFDKIETTPYLGSLTALDFTNNSMNEYTDVGGATHTYDANGNLTDDGVNSYEYDFHNHLIEVVDNGTSATVAEYAYDCLGRGRRVEKTVGSDTTRFVYHDQHCVEEYDGSGDLLRLFVYRDELDTIVMMEAPDYADVDGDADTSELKRFYYHGQLIGSVTHVTDPDENVVESYEYGAYGETTVFDDTLSPVSGSQITNPFMFTARRLDEETGLYYYRARHYSPELGRFIQRDPLEYVDGPNAFTYCGSRPSGSTDPLGLEEKSWWEVALEWAGDAWETIKDAGAAVVEGVVEVAKTTAGKILDAVGEGLKALGAVLGGFFTKIGDFLKGEGDEGKEGEGDKDDGEQKEEPPDSGNNGDKDVSG